jgi:hypothetical protein
LAIKLAQRIDEVVKMDWSAPRRLPQRGDGFDCASIRGPRGEDGAFLGQRQIGIVDHVCWTSECVGWMQKCIQIETVIVVLAHWRPTGGMHVFLLSLPLSGSSQPDFEEVRLKRNRP